LGLEIEEVGGVTVVTFQGHETTLEEKDVHTVRSQLLTLAEQKGRKEFILDLSNVQLIDEEALARLSALNKEIKQADGRLRLCSFHSGIREVFALTGIDSLLGLDIYEDVEQALNSAERTMQDVQVIPAEAMALLEKGAKTSRLAGLLLRPRLRQERRKGQSRNRLRQGIGTWV